MSVKRMKGSVRSRIRSRSTASEAKTKFPGWGRSNLAPPARVLRIAKDDARPGVNLRAEIERTINRYDFERSDVMKTVRIEFPDARLFAADLDLDTLYSMSVGSGKRFDGQVRLRLTVPYQLGSGDYVDASIVKPVHVRGHVDSRGASRIDALELVS